MYKRQVQVNGDQFDLLHSLILAKIVCRLHRAGGPPGQRSRRIRLYFTTLLRCFAIYISGIRSFRQNLRRVGGLSLHDRGALDGRVCEDVRLVPARRGELRDHGALVPGGEPVQRAGIDGVLLAGPQDDLPAGGEVRRARGGDARRALRVRGVADEEVALAIAAAEGLLLARLAFDRGMHVLRAGLARCV